VSVAPTTIEEYEILYGIGRNLGVRDMPKPVLRPEPYRPDHR
jgi:hypothetical protein